jgi:hypothetical protein
MRKAARITRRDDDALAGLAPCVAWTRSATQFYRHVYLAGTVRNNERWVHIRTRTGESIQGTKAKQKKKRQGKREAAISMVSKAKHAGTNDNEARLGCRGESTTTNKQGE